MNWSVRPKAFVKREFSYNRSIFKEIYAISENDVLRYNREFVITEFVINGFICICTIEKKAFDSSAHLMQCDYITRDLKLQL